MAAAVAAGADAVYFGVEDLNARAKADNVAQEQLPAVVDWLHGQRVNAHVALNVPITEASFPRAAAILATSWLSGADAVIVRDPLLMTLCREVFPGMEVHASTQFGVVGPAMARRAQALGCSRAILARELSIRSIRSIAAATPGLDLEAFVFGALCFGLSGRCLLGEAVGGRSGNYGACLQACRLEWFDVAGRSLGRLFSMKDLDLVVRIPELAGAGVMSLKIEGRLKSPAWVACVTQWVRRASEAWRTGGLSRSDLAAFHRDVSVLFSRQLTDALLDGRTGREVLTAPAVSGHMGLAVRGVSVKAVRGVPAVEFVAPVALSVRDGLLLWVREPGWPGGPTELPVAILRMLDAGGRPVPVAAAGAKVTVLVPAAGNRQIAGLSVHSAQSVERAYLPRAALGGALRPRAALPRPTYGRVEVARTEVRISARLGRLEHEASYPIESSAARGAALGREQLAPLFGDAAQFDVTPGLFVNPTVLKAARRRFCSELESAFRLRLAALGHACARALEAHLESHPAAWPRSDAELLAALPACVSMVTGFQSMRVATSGRDEFDVQANTKGTSLYWKGPKARS